MQLRHFSLVITCMLWVGWNLAYPVESLADRSRFDWLGKIAIDADGIQSDDPQIRSAAVRAIATYDIAWTKEQLLESLRDPDANVRIAAGRALALHEVRSTIAPVIKWLSEPNTASREAAATILGDLRATSAVAPLVRALGDPVPMVRVSSLVALGKIGGSAVVLPIVSRLGDEKFKVRLAAVQQLYALRDARSLVPLVALFRDSNQEVRTRAILTAGRLGEPQASRALLRELGDLSKAGGPVGLAVVSALGTLGDLSALPNLMWLMKSGKAPLRSKATFSVAQIAKANPNDPKAKESIGALVEALADPRIHKAAYESLKLLGGLAVPDLIESLRGTRAGNPPMVVTLLQESADRRATLELVSELHRGRVSTAAVLGALAKTGDPRALQPILALLSSKSEHTRLLAMQALAPLLDDPNASADLIVYALADPSLKIRLLAARYLGVINARSSVAALIGVLESTEEPALQAEVLQALGKIRDPRATTSVVHLLESSNNSAIRSIAADALSELRDSRAIEPLFHIASTEQHKSRALAVLALGSILRDTQNQEVLALLLSLSSNANSDLALAAIEALSALGDEHSGPQLLKRLDTTSPQLRIAVIRALGELRFQPAQSRLESLLAGRTPKISSMAAWSLGMLGGTGATSSLLLACSSADLPVAINASAALAQNASVNVAQKMARLLLHASPLVRINSLTYLGRVHAVRFREKVLALLGQDISWLVRVAAIRTLSRMGEGRAAITKASIEDTRPEVREAALAALQGSFVATYSTRGAIFRIIDPLRDDHPLGGEARFFVTDDGLATVHYSNSLGRISFRNFIEGPFTQGPLANVSAF